MVVTLSPMCNPKRRAYEYKKKYPPKYANLKIEPITDAGERSRLEDISKNLICRSNFTPSNSATGTYSKLY